VPRLAGINSFSVERLGRAGVDTSHDDRNEKY
jgi:hypothetical protein